MPSETGRIGKRKSKTQSRTSYSAGRFGCRRPFRVQRESASFCSPTQILQQTAFQSEPPMGVHLHPKKRMHLDSVSKANLLAANTFIVLALAGCQVQTREAAAPGTGPYRPPRPATKDDLVQRIHRASDPLDSFTMRANLVPSSGD